MHLVEQYWAGVQRRLQAEVEDFNSLIGHQGEKGRENELSLARVIERLVPTRYGVGAGLIFDVDGQQSKQTDIVLFDAVDEPAVLAQTNQVLFPIENVRGAIEVKTSVGKAEIEDIGEKVRSVRKLNTKRKGRPPIYAAVGYKATRNPATIASHVIGLAPEDRPDILLVVDPAIVGMSAAVAKDLGIDVPEGVEYLIGVTPLQQRDGDNRAIPGSYATVPDDDERRTLISGTSYGVYDAGGDLGYYVAESARALLVFGEALVTSLALADDRNPPGFHHYVGPEMRDTLSLF